VSKFKKIQILHIEDNPLYASIVRETLKPKNAFNLAFEIDHSVTLEDSIQKSEDKTYDAVLMDLNLSDSMGIDTLKRYQELFPDVPIIVLSGNDGADLGLASIVSGAQEYLVKNTLNQAFLIQIIQSSIYRKKVENNLYQKAHYDPLTSLPNKSFFKDVVENMINKALRWERREALLFIDLDKFKAVNDTHGHDSGDFVIKQTASRIKKILRHSDILARFAGDEFLLYLDSDGKAPLQNEHLLLLSKKIINAVTKPIDLRNGHKANIGCSIGIAVCPDHGNDFETLLKSADEAMYSAKDQGGNSSFISDIEKIESLKA